MAPIVATAAILGLLAAEGPAKDPDIPLVVTQVRYVPGERFVEYELRNDGLSPVIAWETQLALRYADGTESIYGHMVDAYQDAAGLRHAPPGNRVIQPGATRREQFPVQRRREGSAPEGANVRVGAVIVDGNRPLGDARLVEGILASRRVNAQVWANIATSIRSACAAARGDIEALRKAADTLKPDGRSEQPFERTIRTNLVIEANRARRGEGDAGKYLARLIEEAEQSAEAARRFAILTP